MPAGINIKTGKVHYWFYDWKNSFVVIECLEKLLIEYSDKNIYVIMDNWSAHKSYSMKVWNYFHPRIHLVYLPSGASFLNKIERVFCFLSRDILQNSNFQTILKRREVLWFSVVNQLTIFPTYPREFLSCIIKLNGLGLLLVLIYAYRVSTYLYEVKNHGYLLNY